MPWNRWGEPVPQRAFFPTHSFLEGRQKPDIPRMSCSFNAGGKKREGIPSTEKRHTKHCLESESQNVLKHLWLQYPRWGAILPQHLLLSQLISISLSFPRGAHCSLQPTFPANDSCLATGSWLIKPWYCSQLHRLHPCLPLQLILSLKQPPGWQIFDQHKEGQEPGDWGAGLPRPGLGPALNASWGEETIMSLRTYGARPGTSPWTL